VRTADGYKRLSFGVSEDVPIVFC